MRIVFQPEPGLQTFANSVLGSSGLLIQHAPSVVGDERLRRIPERRRDAAGLVEHYQHRRGEGDYQRKVLMQRLARSFQEPVAKSQR
jgi:hypothetical protein